MSVKKPRTITVYDSQKYKTNFLINLKILVISKLQSRALRGLGIAGILTFLMKNPRYSHTSAKSHLKAQHLYVELLQWPVSA